jgi:hypothetical protein
MLSTLVAASLGILVAAVERPAEESNRSLTPADVVAKFHSVPLKDVVVVKYRVRDVAESNPDWTFLYADKLPNRNLFAVKLSREARDAFKKRGVSNIGTHFAGKDVEFAGHVEVVTLWCFPACDLYTLRVDSLEQLLAIREINREDETDH